MNCLKILPFVLFASPLGGLLPTSLWREIRRIFAIRSRRIHQTVGGRGSDSTVTDREGRFVRVPSCGVTHSIGRLAEEPLFSGEPPFEGRRVGGSNAPRKNADMNPRTPEKDEGFLRLRRKLLGVERKTLVDLFNRHEIHVDVFSRLLHELDVEEAKLTERTEPI
jgi:hypothetical protein